MAFTPYDGSGSKVLASGNLAIVGPDRRVSIVLPVVDDFRGMGFDAEAAEADSVADAAAGRFAEEGARRF